MENRVLGKYELLEEVGRGGMGVVYKALQQGLNRTVALKVLPEHLAADNEASQRFLREARAAATLEHPNIVTIYDVGEHEGVYYCAMQFLEGKNIVQLVRENGPLGLSEAVSIAAQVADGLSCAHEKGIVHRDIKPGNIIIDDDGKATLTDFGIARGLGQTRLTLTGVAMGSPGYMAPEQVLGKDVDHRADLYALGVVLFEMLTGEMPFSGDTPMAVLYKHIHEPVPSASQRVESLSKDVDDCIARLMAKEPKQRFSTARDLRFTLNSLGAGPHRVGAGSSKDKQPVLKVVEKPEKTETSSEPKKLKKTATAFSYSRALILLILLLAAGGGLYLYRGEKPSDPQKPPQKMASFREEPELIWQYSKPLPPPPPPTPGKSYHRPYYYVSFDFAPGLVFARMDEDQYALDVSDGEVLWKKKDASIYQIVDGNALLKAEDKIISASARSGDENWRYYFPPNNDVNVTDIHFPLWYFRLYRKKADGKTDWSQRYSSAVDVKRGESLWEIESPFKDWTNFEQLDADTAIFESDEGIGAIDSSSGIVKWKKEISHISLEPQVHGDVYVGTGWVDEGKTFRIKSLDKYQDGFYLGEYQTKLLRLEPQTGNTVWDLGLSAAPAHFSSQGNTGYLVTWGRWDFQKKHWREYSGFQTLDLTSGKISKTVSIKGFPSRAVHYRGLVIFALSAQPRRTSLNDPGSDSPPPPEPPPEEPYDPEAPPPPENYPYPMKQARVLALKPESGAVVWEHELEFANVFQVYSCGDYLLVMEEDDLVAFEMASGRLAWRYQLKDRSTTICTKSIVYVESEDQYLNAFDVATGKVLWRKRMEKEIKNFELTQTHLFVGIDAGRSLKVYAYESK